MTASVTHAKVSGISDGPDTSMVQPSDWNAGHVISGVWSVVMKTADESRNTTTTPADDATLLVALDAGMRYHIRVRAYFETANATMDFKWSSTYTGTTTKEVLHRRFAAAGAAVGTDNELTSTSSGLIANSANTATTSGIGLVEIDVILTTATSGTFSFQWAQNTSDAGSLTMLAGSYLEYFSA